MATGRRATGRRATGRHPIGILIYEWPLIGSHSVNFETKCLHPGAEGGR